MRRGATRNRLERKHTPFPKHSLWRKLPEARPGDLMPPTQKAANRVVQMTARRRPSFALADHSLGLVVEGGDDLVGFSSAW